MRSYTPCSPRSADLSRRLSLAARLRCEPLEDRTTPAGWAFGVGSRHTDLATSVAVAPGTGDVYVAGLFYNTKPAVATDFDPGPGTAALSAVGGVDHFLAKYTAAGQFAWARRVGADGNELTPPTVRVDAAGNAYFAGTAAGGGGGVAGVGGNTAGLSAVALSGTSRFGESAVVAKFAPDGRVVWARQFVGTTGDPTTTTDLGVSPADGSLYVAGSFSNTADFDPAAAYPDNRDRLTAAAPGVQDRYVAKLAADGSVAWARRGSASFVAPAADGGVYLSGEFTGTTTMGGVSLTSPSGRSSFAARMDAAGNVLWARRMGGPLTGGSIQGGVAAGLDPVTGQEAVYVGGSFAQSGTYPRPADFGDPTNPGDVGAVALTTAGGYDAFVCRLDAAGNFLWTRQLGGSADDRLTDVAVDPAGGVYATGNFRGTVDFDPGAGTAARTSGGGTDGFTWKLDSSGSFAWAAQTAGSLDSTASGVMVDGAGNVYTVGSFAGTTTFDTGAGTVSRTSVASGGAPSDDAFVLKTTVGGMSGAAFRGGGAGPAGTAGETSVATVPVEPLPPVVSPPVRQTDPDPDAGSGVRPLSADWYLADEFDFAPIGVVPKHGKTWWFE